MKRLLLAAAVVSLLATNSWGAIRLNSSRSNNCREYPNAAVVTGTVDLPGGPAVSAVVYAVPAKGDFVLTQFCASPDANGGIRLDATGFGAIAQTVNGVSCYTFNPGVSIPRGSELTCTTSSSASSSAGSLVVTPGYFCMITGMQTAK